MAEKKLISIELNDTFMVEVDPTEVIEALESPLLDKVKEDIEYKIESAIEDIDFDDKVSDWMYNSFDISDYSRDIGEHAWQAVNDEVDLNALADDVKCLQDELEPIKDIVSLSLNPDLPSMFKSLKDSKMDLEMHIHELEAKYAPFDKIRTLLSIPQWDVVDTERSNLKKFWVMDVEKSTGNVSFGLIDRKDNESMFSSLYMEQKEHYDEKDNMYYNPFTVFSKAIIPTEKEIYGETKEKENV